MKIRTALICATALSLFACEAPTDLEAPESGPDLATRVGPIYGGFAPNTTFHKAVVSLHQVSGGYASRSPFCSGTLVTPEIVVTAAHCLDVAKGGKPKFQTMSPSALAIYVGDAPKTDSAPAFFAVTETVIHPAYNRSSNNSDIAIVRIAAPVPGSMATPVPWLPASLAMSGADIGATLNFAGFGEIESGDWGVKLQANGALGGFGCSVSGCSSPGDAATMISYTQAAAGPCFGDSGGPAFIFRSGAPYLAGITSYGDSYCTIYGVSTRADAFDAWISSFTTVTPPPDCGANGTCNAACAPGADPDCGGAASCGDGTCGAGESCDGRSGTTACTADCAGKLGGKPTGRFCQVEGVCEGPGC